MTAGDLPLTPYQESLFFLHRLAPENPFYTNGVALRLRGPLDVPALRRALDDVLDRHPALRATFDLVAGTPVQRIGSPVRLEVRDLRHLPAADRAAAAIAHATQEARRPFDLRTGPAFRPSLAVLGAAEHVLSLVAHHIVSDGPSVAVVVGDLAQRYGFHRGHLQGGHAQGRRAAGPAPLSYPEYCRRSARPDEATRHRLQRDLAYWHEQLHGADLTVDLLTDRPRPVARARTGDSVVADLPAGLLAAARRLCAGLGVSMFVLLLASFRTLLAQQTGRHDLLIATTISRRTRPELRRLVGYFVNPVLVRTPLRAASPFTELLAAERRSTLGALGHAAVPFAEVVRALGAPRRGGTDAMFQVLFDFQDHRPEQAMLDAFTCHDLTAGIVELDTATAPVDLALCAADRGDGVRLTYRYDSELFDRDTVEALARRHRMLLDAVLEAPQQPVSAHPLLTRDEREATLRHGRGRPAPGPGDTTIHQLFEDRVDAAPGAVAVADAARALTYGQLERLANAGAHRLRRAGLRPGELCVVWSNRLDVATVVALLAVLKAGGAYLAFDPDHPVQRWAPEIDRLGLRFATGPQPPAAATTAVELPTRADTLRTGEEGRVPRLGGGARLAYGICTSGSTGRPKVVGITHAGAVNFLRWACGRFSADDLACVLATTPPLFDCPLFELFTPLCSGGTAVLAGSPLQLRKLAAAHPISLVSTVPATMTELLRGGRLPDSVRAVNLAGEPMPRDMPGEVFAASRAERVGNFYGPSETTTYTTGRLHLRTGEPHPAPGPGVASRSVIGRPIDNVAVYVLDGDRLLPPGAPGELCIGGAGVGIGYLGDPARTAASFVPDPFATEPGARMYRTGDRARWLTDGTLEFLGRMDRQLKIRGIRVEPADVEVVLRAHPAVRDAAVVPGGTSGSGAAELVAFVLPADPDGTGTDLTDHLVTRLPRHLLPRSVTWLPAFPLTANGKLDRDALPAGARPARRTLLPGPTGFVEQAVVDIFRLVLGCADVGRSDDFFERGGDSLRAIAVLAAVADELGVDVALESFLASPTVDGLAALIERDWTPGPRGSLAALRPAGTGPPLFFVHGGSGDLGFLYSLCAAVDFDRPVYGLRSSGLDGWGSPLDTVERMAEAYLREMRQVAPSGPYLLAGNCMGGLVAYELAQRLTRDGATVAFLGLVNTVVPEDGSCRAEQAGAAGESLVEHRLAALRHQYEALGGGYLIDRDLDSATGDRPSFFRRWIQVALGNEQAGDSYRPTGYDGDVHFFTDEPPERHVQRWAPLVLGAIHVHRFPPSGAPLAARGDLGTRLRECLEQSTAARSGALG